MNVQAKYNKLITLHSLIKLRLKERGKTLEEMFAYLKISRAWYGKTLKNQTTKLTLLEGIAAFLEISLPEFLLPLYYNETESKMIQANIDFIRNENINQ